MTSRPRVLMTLADVAWPVDAGKRLRCNAMVNAVAATCEVDVVVLFADTDPQVSPLPPGISGSWQVIPPMTQPPARAAFDVARQLVPWQVGVQDWARVRALIGEHGNDYDLIWFGALDHFSQLASSVTAAATVVDCDDVETEKLKRFLALPKSQALPWRDRVQRRVELPMWGSIQRKAVQHADAVLVCSELDRQRLVSQASRGDPAAAARIVSVPNTYVEPVDPPLRDPQGELTLVVVANYGTDQNLDAANFVARDVVGPLRRAIPGGRVRLVGRRADRLDHLEGIDGLDVVGAVDDVAAELSRAHAVLVPIRFGGGTRLKVVEAFAYSVPVISTGAGAEGIDATDGTELLLADSAEQIVAAAQRLLADPELAGRVGAAGRALYERSFRPQATTDAVTTLLNRLIPRD